MATEESKTSFQHRVMDWAIRAFGEADARNLPMRRHRFLEEALEAVQADGGTKEEALELVEYVFGRPIGMLSQEIGGIMVTLACWCEAHGIFMGGLGERELQRCHDRIETIREKHKNKPTFEEQVVGMELQPDDRDVLMLRSVAAMAIAEGDPNWQTIPVDCPMLEAVANLRRNYDSLLLSRGSNEMRCVARTPSLLGDGPFNPPPFAPGKITVVDDPAVDHPAHYGGEHNVYEAIKVIDAWGLGFCLGNTVKYISRAGKKVLALARTDHNKAKLEDLKKARWYLDHEIQQLEQSLAGGQQQGAS